LLFNPQSWDAPVGTSHLVQRPLGPLQAIIESRKEESLPHRLLRYGRLNFLRAEE
jgi:hypothetical protein